MSIGKSLSIVRIGDSMFHFNQDDNHWYAQGYFQVNEILDYIQQYNASLCLFGRVTRHAFPHELAFKMPGSPELVVDGVINDNTGLVSHLKTLPRLFINLEKINHDYDIKWFMLPSFAGLAGLLLTSKKGVRVAQMVGEWQAPLRARYPVVSRVLIPILETLTRFAVSRADISVFVSRYLREKFGSKRVEHNVIVANESRLNVSMFNSKERTSVNTPLQVLYVGRLVPEKGLLTLIHAVALVNETLNCELTVSGLGNGDFTDFLMKICTDLGIEDKVRWLGWTKWGESLFELMRKSDVFVLPSLSEGLPLVLLEAMSQKTPVIGTDIPGIRELVNHGTTGLLFEVNNPDDLARQIIRVATDTHLRRTIVSNSYGLAKENTFEATTGRVIASMINYKNR